MESQQSQPINVISLSKKATLKTLMQDIGNTPETLLEDLQQQGINSEEPMIFVYRGCEGNMEKPFDLQICQPVNSSDGYSGRFDIEILEPFQYVERSYIGRLADMGRKGYEPFIADLQKGQLTLSDQCREVYTKFTGPESEDNITELQLGIVS